MADEQKLYELHYKDDEIGDESMSQIMPHSVNWRSGCVRSLRKAINALKEEKNHAR